MSAGCIKKNTVSWQKNNNYIITHQNLGVRKIYLKKKNENGQIEKKIR